MRHHGSGVAIERDPRPVVAHGGAGVGVRSGLLLVVQGDPGVEGLDVGPDRFGDPQPVERQHRDQRMLGCGAEPSGDEEGADLVAVQADGVGFVVDPGAPDMDCRRMGDEAFFFGVSVEAGHGAQPSGDGGRGPTPSFELTSEALDVAPADLEQPEVALIAEGDDLARIQGVGVRVRPR